MKQQQSARCYQVHICSCWTHLNWCDNPFSDLPSKRYGRLRRHHDNPHNIWSILHDRRSNNIPGLSRSIVRTTRKYTWEDYIAKISTVRRNSAQIFVDIMRIRIISYFSMFDEATWGFTVYGYQSICRQCSPAYVTPRQCSPRLGIVLASSSTSWWSV